MFLKIINIKKKTQQFFPRTVITYVKNTFDLRYHSTIDLSPDEEKLENSSFKSTKRKAKASVSPEIVKYLNKHNPSLDVKSIPEKYMVKSKNAKTLYLVNHETAGKFFLW